ncbi:mycothione reductase [Ornithinicoccus hortensis]|uniref:Mycothione reductase n=1 Tax=Ornithinicoccus hortensis TaxID=82346 RepID=A0A542YQF6_9MICO|nr:mycothione reductase [Ornithinicoccus hortensis]TQL50326.1 mycothione reductase [Ornithinicoccus hortensis]
MTDFDLVIIGSGSGNSLVTPDFDGSRVAVVERGTFGGTCLNVGCIPTKMFVYAADVATTIREASRYGVDATLDGVRWQDIRDRVFGRIDPISAGGRDYRVDGPNTTAYLGQATFTGPGQLEVEITQPGGEHAVGQRVPITGKQIVLAAGSRAVVPDVFTDSGVPFHTSDTIMRIEELPGSLAIVGGGFIAAEFAHVFSALGVRVHQIARGDALLRHLDTEISQRFTEQARQQWDVRLNTQVTGLSEQDGGTVLALSDGTELAVDQLLVAVGRVPNSDGMGLDLAGVEVHDDGRIKVDEFGRTAAQGVWSLGDASSPYQLKHVANHEARAVAHNLVHPEDLRAFDHRYVPSAVFTHPQIATVGLTEDEARAAGYRVSVKVQNYGDTAYGWAMEDTTGIAKLVGDADTGRILGAHLMGPHASSLIQPLIQAMSFDQPAQAVARGQYWIHPALAEVVENALLGLQSS